VLAEAAAYRTGLRRVVSYGFGCDSVSSRALAHLTEHDVYPDVSQAIRATPDDTADGLAEIEEAETGVGRALDILRRNEPGAYEEALYALHPGTFDWWYDECRQAGAGDSDEQPYEADADGLASFLCDEVLPWLARRGQVLKRRPLVRAQALGQALDPDHSGASWEC
jgi:hypothetical protein